MTVAQLRTDLQVSREHLFAPLQGLNEEQFRHVPAAGAWSIATHLAHVLRCERLYTERALRALREDDPRIESTGTSNDDEPALAERLAVPQIIHGLQAVRRTLDDALAGCDETAVARAIIHSRYGRITVAGMATKMATHEDEHATDVARIAAEAPATRRMIIPLREHS